MQDKLCVFVSWDILLMLPVYIYILKITNVVQSRFYWRLLDWGPSDIINNTVNSDLKLCYIRFGRLYIVMWHNCVLHFKGCITVKWCHFLMISVHPLKSLNPLMIIIEYCRCLLLHYQSVYVKSCHFSGAEDVVTAFSRSETEDRRQWPLPFSRPHSAPVHLAMPRHVRSPTPTPQTTLLSSGEVRHQVEGGGRLKRREETAGGGCLAVPPSSSHPDTSWHTLPEMHSKLRCGLKPWQQGSQWKHSQIEYEWFIFSFCEAVFLFWLILFSLRL